MPRWVFTTTNAEKKAKPSKNLLILFILLFLFSNWRRERRAHVITCQNMDLRASKKTSQCVRACVCVYKEKGSFFLPSAPTIICPDLLSIWPFETHLLPRTIKLNGRRRTQEDLLSECSCEEEDLVCLAFFPFFLVHHPWDQ